MEVKDKTEDVMKAYGAGIYISRAFTGDVMLHDVTLLFACYQKAKSEEYYKSGFKNAF